MINYITIKELIPRYWHGNSNQPRYDIVDTTVYDDDLKQIKNFSKHLNIITEFKGDEKVYFSKSSSIPRYKFREYSKDKELNRIINLQKADVIVFNPDTFVKDIHIVSKSYVLVKKNELEKQFITHEVPEEFYITKDAFVGYQKANFLDFFKTYKDNIQSRSYISGYTHSYRDDESLRTFVNEFNELSKSSKKIIFDNDVSKQISGDCSVIDDQMYDELAKMFNSGDVKNVSLAMDIMANTDYEQSEFKILMLLSRFYASAIINNPSKNLVNFKNFLKYFNKYLSSISNPLLFCEKMLINLKEDSIDAEERRKYCIETVKEYIERRMLYNTKFKIKELEFNK